jgi:hypothetical protein
MGLRRRQGAGFRDDPVDGSEEFGVLRIDLSRRSAAEACGRSHDDAYANCGRQSE